VVSFTTGTTVHAPKLETGRRTTDGRIEILTDTAAKCGELAVLEGVSIYSSICKYSYKHLPYMGIWRTTLPTKCSRIGRNGYMYRKH
jgi:L-aminopeptidase/D-esterase-like protein